MNIKERAFLQKFSAKACHSNSNKKMFTANYFFKAATANRQLRPPSDTVQVHHTPCSGRAHLCVRGASKLDVLCPALNSHYA